MKILFQAHIKDINQKLLASGDVSTYIKLTADNLSNETLNELNSLMNSNENKSREIKVYMADAIPTQ